MIEFTTVSKTSSNRLLDVPAVFCANLTHGDQVYVQSSRCNWVWNATFPIASTADNKTICRPTEWRSDGAFMRDLTSIDPSWMLQTEWVVDELNSTALANDENDGLTATTPLLTAAERWRRMGPNAQWKASTAYHIRHLSTCAAEAIDGEMLNANVSIYIHASMTDRTADLLFSGTATTVQALTTASNLANEIVSASIPVSWATAGPASSTLVGKRIRITSGASINAVSWVTKDMGGAAPLARARFAEFLTPVASFSAAPFAAPTTATAALTNGDTFVVEGLRTITRLSVRLRNPTGTPTSSRVVLDSISAIITEAPSIGIYSDGSEITTLGGTFAGHTMHSCKLSAFVDTGFKSITGGYSPGSITILNRSATAGTFTRFTIQGAFVVDLGGGVDDGGISFTIGQVGMYDTTTPPLLFCGRGVRLSSSVFYGTGNTAQFLRLDDGTRFILTSFTSTAVTTALTHFTLGSGNPSFRTAAPALDESGGTPVWTALRDTTFTNMLATVAAGGFGPIWTDPVTDAGWSN